MNIGLIAPPWTPVPPVGYGGTESVVDCLARGLKELGHQVLLFTVGDSTCPVPRAQLFATPPQPMGASVEEAAHVLAAYEALATVDLIHDHTILGPLIAQSSGLPSPPIVSTHHGSFSFENRRIFRRIAQRASVIAISHDQRESAPDVPIAAVIHHGIDLDTYQLGTGGGAYLLFMGRMSPDKGVAAALRVARASGYRLVLATKMREAAERDYFERDVQPLLRGDDMLLIEPPIAERLELLRGALALLNPIAWPEPFGLVMAEALATGTPVLAYRCGAAPEIVDDGITGFLCSDEAAMIAAVDRVAELNRSSCRAAAEERFSLRRMARDHVALYEAVLADQLRHVGLHLARTGLSVHPSDLDGAASPGAA